MSETELETVNKEMIATLARLDGMIEHGATEDECRAIMRQADRLEQRAAELIRQQNERMIKTGGAFND